MRLASSILSNRALIKSLDWRLSASGKLLPGSLIRTGGTAAARSSSACSALLSNQLVLETRRPFPFFVHRRADSCQGFATKRDFLTGNRLLATGVTSREEDGETSAICDRMSHVKVFERLPKSVVPVHYEITIKPDLVKLIFDGSESVLLKVFALSLS